MALRRAAHQVFDRPLVFEDPLALRILGLAGADAKALARSDLRAPSRPHSVGLRAFLVARSRLAEDTLHAALQTSGVTQYVLLGAGLDTFAYRNEHAALRVFEVDHPDTQRWKRCLLEEHGIPVPPGTVHVAVDFSRDRLGERLAAEGFRADEPAVFAWLGVVPYLPEAGFAATLGFLSRCAKGSVLVMDYGLPREALPPQERLALDSLAARVAAAGEPFQLFFTPEALHTRLTGLGWTVMEDLGCDEINARYFAGRTDGLRCLTHGGRMLSAALRA